MSASDAKRRAKLPPNAETAAIAETFLDAMAAPAFSPHLLARARVVRSGVCICCCCTDAFGCREGCSWEPGTDERLCSAHPEREKDQARAALAAADREKAKPRKEARRA